jgi:hypothetical protein
VEIKERKSITWQIATTILTADTNVAAKTTGGIAMNASVTVNGNGHKVKVVTTVEKDIAVKDSGATAATAGEKDLAGKAVTGAARVAGEVMSAVSRNTAVDKVPVPADGGVDKADGTKVTKAASAAASAMPVRAPLALKVSMAGIGVASVKADMTNAGARAPRRNLAAASTEVSAVSKDHPDSLPVSAAAWATTAAARAVPSAAIAEAPAWGTIAASIPGAGLAGTGDRMSASARISTNA